MQSLLKMTLKASLSIDADPANELFSGTEAPDQETVHSLIYQYLIHNCYGETAQAFRLSSGADSLSPTTPEYTVVQEEVDDMDIDDADEPTNVWMQEQTSFSNTGKYSDLNSNAVKTLAIRKKLRQFIISGSILEAIEHCEQIFPSLLTMSDPKNIDVLFLLRTQQFIELVKQSAPTALQFAQEGRILLTLEFGLFVTSNVKYSQQLQDIIALIAYPNPHQSPISHLLTQSRRETVSDAVNNHILCISNLM